MEQNKFKRRGENYKSPYRSGRFYLVAIEWYFSARETDDQAPFPNKISTEERFKK